MKVPLIFGSDPIVPDKLIEVIFVLLSMSGGSRGWFLILFTLNIVSIRGT